MNVVETIPVIPYPARLTPRARTALVLLFGLDTLVLAGFLVGDLSGAAALIGHGLNVCLFVATARPAFAADLTFLVVVALLAAGAGPFGILASVVLYALLARTNVAAADLERWYRQISGAPEPNAAAALYDRIVDGRARRPGPDAVARFHAVLEGPLAQQQALLGLIGLSYFPEYRPLLRKALCSEEPSIRVHAAAVSVKLRTALRAEFGRACGDAGHAPAADLVRAERLALLADSGFLDPAESATAREAALTLCRPILQGRPEDRRLRRQVFELLAGLERWDELRASLDATRARSPEDAALGLRCLMELGRTRDLHRAVVRPASVPSRPGASHDPVLR
ncbi:hypothetical protein PMNALOAF_0857 [Methylobacterium adhaesivum]|jgi:hypothetical protein|uniref:HEAT repeat domain-containing protein n=1 Tax=Methylobacterium adhaesivum TaxID=333297 RepID=A0ABT8BFR6_9HYPH|nr:hypothetical protein [Methylobacterium adhaesivum]MDN3590987.1 hypothetical protein [Methylobacterium adhaesivum]GJD29622.1 hypothetical protein PMNALOAF_0857 [Methylobacterium adhaesivum]